MQWQAVHFERYILCHAMEGEKSAALTELVSENNINMKINV